MTYFITNILSFLREKNGEYRLRNIIANFSCEKNPDLEHFLKSNAINFARQGIAITYFVIGIERNIPLLLGYFTLANESLEIDKYLLGEPTSTNESKTGMANCSSIASEMHCIEKTLKPLSRSTTKILNRFFSKYISKDYRILSTIFIAQLSKNDSAPNEVKAKFSGSRLMDCAIKMIMSIQYNLGGRVIFLECANNPFLIDFYEKQGFFYIGSRFSSVSEPLLKYMKILRLKTE